MRDFVVYAIAGAIALSILCCANLALASGVTSLPSDNVAAIGTAPVGNDLSLIDIGGFLRQVGGFIRIGISTVLSGGGGGGLGPTQPTNLIATPVSSSQVDLSWSPSSGSIGVAGYQIFRDGVQVATDTSGTTYNDTGLSVSTLHTYWVAAYDSADDISTSSAAVTAVTDFGPDQFGTTWKPIRIGAGGFVTDMDVASDGTMVARTDTYGAYIWDGTQWDQLVTASSMPAGAVSVGGTGVYEIAIAPSNSNIFYMEYNGYVYKTINRGATWTQTNFAQVTDGSNDNYRTYGRKMAIDPANPNIVYASSPSSGIFVTTDGGNTWSQITQMGTTTGEGFAVAFDPTSSVVGGVTQGIYIADYGTGVYHSTNGGTSWTLTSGGPTTFTHMIVAQNGEVLVCPDSNPANEYLDEYSGGSWGTSGGFGYGETCWSMAVNPNNVNNIYMLTGEGTLMASTDGGATWSSPPINPGPVVATDIPWLAWSQNSQSPPFMAGDDIRFDPTNTNILYMPAGLGFWYTTISSIGATVTWNSQNKGIEQLSSINVISPPGGQPIVTTWDRADFYVGDPDVYPSQYGVPVDDGNLTMGWDFDYASNDPSYIAGIMNWQGGEEQSGYSTDGGQTWHSFATKPAEVTNDGAIGGSIAVASSTDIVWIPSNSSQPYYTLDGGNTWTAVDPAGTTANDAGWGWAYYLYRRIVTADRVNIGTFYAYNNNVGVFRSTDGGVTWTLVYSGTIPGDGGYNAKLKADPGRAGELFFTGGSQGTLVPATYPFEHSTNGGATWSAVPNVAEVLNFGFGKAASGTTTPAIYIAGWVSGQYGIWESDDDANTWTQVGEWPLGILSEVQGISGDMNIYGRVYVAVAGSGWVYGDTAGATLPPVISSISSTATTTSATITWTTDQSSTSYVQYGTTTGYGSASSSPSMVTSHSITLTGLSVATLYHFEVSSTDSNAETSTSTDQTFSTYDPSPPSAPGSLTATPISSSQIDLSWSTSTDAYSSISEYDVFRNGTKVGTTSLTTYADTNLNSLTSYTYGVVAKDALGLFSATSTASTSTPAYAGPEDVEGQAYAIWSTRCASKSYTGDVADIWDSATGNTTETLLTCSAGGVLNQTINPLSTTCAGGCDVKTLYDQSGSNECGGSPCNVTQATNANRPRLTTNCQNGKICVVFDPVYGNDDCLVSPTTSSVSSQPITTSGVWEDTANYNYTTVWQWGVYANYFVIGTLGNNTAYMDADGYVPTVTFSENALHASQNLFDTTSSTWLEDSTANGPLTIGTNGSSGASSFAFGDNYSGSACADNAVWGGGEWFEFGVWLGNQSANNTAMNSNQHSYWGFGPCPSLSVSTDEEGPLAFGPAGIRVSVENAGVNVLSCGTRGNDHENRCFWALCART